MFKWDLAKARQLFLKLRSLLFPWPLLVEMRSFIRKVIPRQDNLYWIIKRNLLANGGWSFTIRKTSAGKP